MTKHVQCPHCGQAYALTPDQSARFAGRSITCSECNREFTVSSDIAMTGALATEPTPFETRPYATAGAMSAYAPAVTLPAPPMPPMNQAMSGYTVPPRYTPAFQPSLAEVQTNGMATASLILGILGLVIPVIPGSLAVLLGLLALRRARDSDVGAGTALGGIAMGIIGLFVSGAVTVMYVMPAIAQARETSRMAVCAENLRQIGAGMRAYAEANGGGFPTDLETAVASGVFKVELLVCPESNASVAPGSSVAEQTAHLRNGRHVSYKYIGGGLATSSEPECVLLYEPPNRHGPGMHVLFIDGRVQHIGEVEAFKANARLAAGINPPWPRTGK